MDYTLQEFGACQLTDFPRLDQPQDRLQKLIGWGARRPESAFPARQSILSDFGDPRGLYQRADAPAKRDAWSRSARRSASGLRCEA